MPSHGSTNHRGYGHRHRQLRKQWAPKVDAGLVTCWRCGQRIERGERWDLGHHDTDRSKYAGPEHAVCNRSHGASSPTPQPGRWTRADW